MSEVNGGRTGLRLVYMVHDLGDPAVARRLEMLRDHLAEAVVIGFHRAEHPPAQVGGWPTVPLGRTHDARLAQRAGAVLRRWRRTAELAPWLAGADVVIARQLEMLVLARAARARYAPRARLVFECLDIHRAMLGGGLRGRLLRGLEHALLLAADLLVVSSPAFVREYFTPAHGAALPPVCLIENKVLAQEAGAPGAPPAPGPPWRIGWFGVLRCRRSLLLLAELAAQRPGQVEVILRGRPSLTAIPDFDALVAAAPGLRFEGPYDRHTELAAIYGEVHFAWAIDFFEAGANSAWLLPNRLYESASLGAVPIALGTVETGRWLQRQAAGVQLEEPLPSTLASFFNGLTPTVYGAAAAAVGAIPREALVDDGADARRLVAAILPEAQQSG